MRSPSELHHWLFFFLDETKRVSWWFGDALGRDIISNSIVRILFFAIVLYWSKKLIKLKSKTFGLWYLVVSLGSRPDFSFGISTYGALLGTRRKSKVKTTPLLLMLLHGSCFNLSVAKAAETSRAKPSGSTFVVLPLSLSLSPLVRA